MHNNNNNNPNQEAIDPVMAEPPFRTEGIFSKHYLKRWLTKSELWPSDLKVSKNFEQIQEIFKKSANWIWNLNETQFRIEFLDKILPVLGYYTIPENMTPAVGKETPDYLVFSSDESKQKAYRITNQKNRYSEAITCIEAKKYGHNLGEISKKETPGRFPHRQIRDYLQDAYDETVHKPYFKWAILTNGKEWRLYHRNAHTTSFFSLNLARAIKDISLFKYFYVFFRVEAFVQDANGDCRLDWILNESLEKQEKLEKNLKRRIYKVLEILATGFYNHPRNKNKIESMDLLYRTCLIFLYRLLFILYAEGHGYLPIKEHGAGSNKRYRERFSLSRLRNRILYEKIEPADDIFYRLYTEITDLFSLINGSEIWLNEYSNVPRYNGGLFDPELYPELNLWKLGDWTLREVIRSLMYAPPPDSARETLKIDFQERIDYSDLSVRQLGTIYEGLLEHSLKPSAKGRLTLVEDKTNRRSSGSYYTPDYIVKYIVKETIKPLIDEIDKSDSVQNAIKTGVNNNSFALRALNLRILDPAMGSGHFLVRAAEYLAEEIAYHPTTKLAVENKPLDESQDQAEINYWKRHVVESCIYGVDLNDMAVELAKLSLWLTCISSTKPLSYLDHHLRCGNSLIGSSISELNRLKSDNSDSLGLYEIRNIEEALSDAIFSLNALKETVSEKFEDVIEKKMKWKEEVYSRLTPYRDVADLRSAYEMGLEINEEDYKILAVRTLKKDKIAKVLRSKKKTAEDLTKKYHFFHWQLEFPDVFQNGVEGFDAVIGNPPYVRSRNIGSLKIILEKKYQVFSGSADLYTFFIEKGLKLLRPEGRFGMIVSNKWMRADYGKKLRRLVSQYQIEKLVDFGELPVFESSSTFPLIITISKNAKIKNTIYAPIKRINEDKLDADVETSGFPIDDSSLATNGFSLVAPDKQRLLDKMNESGTSLGTFINGKTYRGIVTGFNKAFIIDKLTRETLIKADPASKKIIKPFVMGDDVRKYEINFREKYIILTKIGVDIENYPVIFKHLKKLESQLKKRSDQGNHWWELRACDYYEEFEKRKIIYGQFQIAPHFAFDDKGYFFSSNHYMITNENQEKLLYVLALLNSNLFFTYMKSNTGVLGDPEKKGRLISQKSHIINFPIPASSDKELEYTINLVKEILDLKQKLTTTLGLKKKTDIETQITECEREIDRIVRRLYGLKD